MTFYDNRAFRCEDLIEMSLEFFYPDEISLLVSLLDRGDRKEILNPMAIATTIFQKLLAMGEG